MDPAAAAPAPRARHPPPLVTTLAEHLALPAPAQWGDTVFATVMILAPPVQTEHVAVSAPE